MNETLKELIKLPFEVLVYIFVIPIMVLMELREIKEARKRNE